jgi:hypothetical protein
MLNTGLYINGESIKNLKQKITEVINTSELTKFDITEALSRRNYKIKNICFRKCILRKEIFI